MKRRTFTMLTEIALCCLPILLFSGCFYLALMQAAEDEHKVSTRHSSVVFDFNNLWEIDFPEEFSPVFIYYQRGGWMGEGSFSAIYECEQPNEQFLKDFSEDMNEEVKEHMSHFDYYYENREQLEEEYDITITLYSENLPDWEQEFISVAYHTSGHHSYRDEFIVYTGKDSCEEYCDEHLYMCYFTESKLLYIYESVT